MSVGAVRDTVWTRSTTEEAGFLRRSPEHAAVFQLSPGARCRLNSKKVDGFESRGETEKAPLKHWPFVLAQRLKRKAALEFSSVEDEA